MLEKQEKYVDLFKAILPTGNPKFVINHVYFDEENMVATDTRVLLIHKHGMDIKTPFCAVNPKVKTNLYNLSDMKNFGSIEMGKQVWTAKESPGYPDYERIVPKTPNYEVDIMDLKPLGLDTLYLYSFNNGIIFDYVGMSAFMKQLSKIMFDKMYFKDKEHPIMLENEDLRVIIMPIVYT